MSDNSNYGSDYISGINASIITGSNFSSSRVLDVNMLRRIERAWGKKIVIPNKDRKQVPIKKKKKKEVLI